MFYCIMRKNGAFYHNKGRIILFTSTQEAENFINMYIQYATERLLKEGNHGAVMTVPMTIMGDSNIIPVSFNIDTVECGVVFASELMNRSAK